MMAAPMRGQTTSGQSDNSLRVIEFGRYSQRLSTTPMFEKHHLRQRSQRPPNLSSGLPFQAVKEYLPNEIAVCDGTEVYPKSASKPACRRRQVDPLRASNVVRVRDYFEASNNRTAYIVMYYEDGEPPDALLRRPGTLTEVPSLIRTAFNNANTSGPSKRASCIAR